MQQLALNGETLTIEDVIAVAHGRPGELSLGLTPAAEEKVRAARAAVEQFVAEGRIIYGITTGFGAFKDRVIPPEQVRELQRNIVMSHAVGVGPAFDTEVVRAMMLIRANTLAKGHSGIRMQTLQLLIDMLMRGVHPIVPVQGSLGASGDLAPLAHIALVVIGLGEAEFGGRRMQGAEALSLAGLTPVTLEAKEGLALTNGTALMAALGCLAVVEAENAALCADVVGALSLEALHGTLWAMDERLHAARPHPRQIDAAATMRQLLMGSTFVRPPDHPDVQDAYTLRCIPQVHGACQDAIKYARWVIEIELNSATDNPLIFWQDDGTPIAISGGNFHGEPLAIAFDYLAVGLTGLGNMSERRLSRLTDSCSNRTTLPDFLTEKGGLNSGFMLVQYTAAALASENKMLVHPASADTIPTSANWEDHVSNGPIAGRRAEIIRNVGRIVAIELLAAAQGIDFRRRVQPDATLGRGTASAYRLVRERVPFIEQDEVMYPHMNAVYDLVSSGQLARSVSESIA